MIAQNYQESVHAGVQLLREQCRLLMLHASLICTRAAVDRQMCVSKLPQILRDPEARTLYNHQLSQAQLKATVVLHDDIQLEDMECADEPCDAGTEGQNETASHSYPCRCGDSYILTAADIRLAAAVGQEIIVPCR